MHLCTWKNPCSPHKSWRWSGSPWLCHHIHRRSLARSYRTHQGPDWRYLQQWTPSLNKDRVKGERKIREKRNVKSAPGYTNCSPNKSVTNQHETRKKVIKMPTSELLNIHYYLLNIFCCYNLFNVALHKTCDNKSDSVSTVICFFLTKVWILKTKSTPSVDTCQRNMSFHQSPNNVPYLRTNPRPRSTLWKWTPHQCFRPGSRNESHMNQVEKPLFHSKMLDLGYIWLHSAQSIYFT